jgi:hypothetical protein
MNVLVFGSNVDQLRAAVDLIAPDTALLRDPNVWAGEVEQCDAVMFLDKEVRQDLLDAYQDIEVLPVPGTKKSGRKKSDPGAEKPQSGEVSGDESQGVQ